METRPCEENTRPPFGDHRKGFSKNYKSTKNYLIVRKIKAKTEAAAFNDFSKQIFKASIHSKKFWQHKYQMTS